jgi:hypothetical protein
MTGTQTRDPVKHHSFSKFIFYTVHILGTNSSIVCEIPLDFSLISFKERPSESQ